MSDPMTPQESSRRSSRSARSAWASVAFIVESVLLLLFLVVSLAVLTRVFVMSLNQSVESRTGDAAVIAASSIAEHFAADPTGIEVKTQLGDLRVETSVVEEAREAGMMYRAHIVVFDVSESAGAGGSVGGTVVYTLDTAVYQPEEA